METINTVQGEVQILEKVNNDKYLVRFTETGGITITSMTRLANGTVRDPMVPRERKERVKKNRWIVVMNDGETFMAVNHKEIADRTGIGYATVQKIAQGTRRADAIHSITKL